MKTVLTVGHSILKTGNCTSADGRPYGGVLEYAYNKNIVNRVAEYLRGVGHKVDVLICGGIGGGARNALAEAGIKLYPGAWGDADAQVNSFLAGNLNYNPDTMCNHHGHGHEEGSCHHHDGGSCGDRRHHS